MNLKYHIKKFIHKFYFFDFFSQKNNIIKSFPRYKLENSENNVLGWVPYIKGKTRICIYNFFSTNYSIRQDIKLNLYLINELKIVNKVNYKIKQDEIINIDLKKIFKSAIGQIVIAQLTSSKIKYRHAGNDGHLRFWGNYAQENNSTISIVHSMPMSNNDLFLKKYTYSRNYNFNNDQDQFSTKNFFTSGVNLIKGNENEQKVFYGYNVVNDQDGNPSSVWHLSPVNKNKNKIEILQSAYCPKIEGLNPFLILDSFETGIVKNHVKFYIVRKNIIEEKKELSTKNLFKTRVSDIFEKKIEPGYSIFMKFQSMGLSHSHIHYAINEKICDQVHMHTSNWNIVENKLKPLTNEKTNNCRKFFYFNFNDPNQKNLAVIHNEKVKDKTVNTLKLRLLSGNIYEKIKTIKFSAERPILTINIDDLFETSEIKDGIIQIESSDYNFHASGLIINTKYNTIAVDHFTGG